MLFGDLNGQEIHRREDMCIHVADSLYCISETNKKNKNKKKKETNTTLSSNCSLILKRKIYTFRVRKDLKGQHLSQEDILLKPE